MPVIHIRGRLTDDPEQFHKNWKSDQSQILCSPVDRDEVGAFEIPITIGDSATTRYPASADHFATIEGNRLVIPPHSAATVESAEDFQVPLNFYGIIFPKGSLVHEHGVLIPTTKIDPGFSGRLRVMLFNTTGRAYTLEPGQPVGSAVFFQTDTTVPNPLVQRRDKLSPRTESLSDRIGEFFRERRTVITQYIIPIAALIVAIVAAYYTYAGYRAAQNTQPVAESTQQ